MTKKNQNLNVHIDSMEEQVGEVRIEISAVKIDLQKLGKLNSLEKNVAMVMGQLATLLH